MSGDTDAAPPTYAVYHKSLADWLTSPDHDYHVSVRKGHEALAALGAAEYRRGPDRMSAYALRHAVRHAIQAERWDIVIGDEEHLGLLCDLRFIEAKCASGLAGEMSEDYAAAEGALPELREQREEKRAARQRSAQYATDLADFAAGRRPDLPDPPPACEPSPALNPDQVKEVFEEPNRANRLQRFGRFFIGHRHALAEYPESTLPVAWNRAETGTIFEQSDAFLGQSSSLWLRRERRPPEPPIHPICRAVLEGHNSGIGATVVSADFARALSGSGFGDETLRLWDLESGACLKILEGHSGRVTVVAVRPDFA